MGANDEEENEKNELVSCTCNSKSDYLCGKKCNNNLIYKNKYLKYKHKYLELKEKLKKV